MITFSIRHLVLSSFNTTNIYSLCVTLLIVFILNCISVSCHFISVHDKFRSVKRLQLSPFTTRNTHSMYMLFFIFFLLHCICFISLVCMTIFCPLNVLYCPIYYQKHIFFAWQLYFLQTSCTFSLFTLRNTYSLCMIFLILIILNLHALISFMCMKTFSPSYVFHCLLLLSKTSLFCA